MLELLLQFSFLNNAAMNMGVQMSLQDPALNPFGSIPTVELLDCMVNLLPTF